MSDLFDRITNAVLDLQSSDFQTYPQCIQKLTRLLSHDDLLKANQELTADVDLDQFIEDSNGNSSGMIGSARLDWPTDHNEELGLKLNLIKKFGEDPNFMKDFAFYYYNSNSSKLIICIQSLIRQLIIPFIRDYKNLCY